MYHRRVIDKMYSEKEDYQSEAYCWVEIVKHIFKQHKSNIMIYKYALMKAYLYIDFICKNHTKANDNLLKEISAIYAEDKDIITEIKKEVGIHIEIPTGDFQIQKRLQSIEKNFRILIEKIRAAKKIWLYGAGVVGRSIAKYLLSNNMCKIEGFIVSKGGDYFDGLVSLKVYNFNSVEIDWKDDLILITALPKNSREIKQKLDELNRRNYHVIAYNEFMTYS